MATGMKRFMLVVTPEMERGVEDLKRSCFYNKPYSEIYRYLIELRLQSIDDSPASKDSEIITRD